MSIVLVDPKVAAVAKRLTPAQFRFLNVASTRPKSWFAMMRHAKLINRTTAVYLPRGLIRWEVGGRYSITPFGEAVRDYRLRMK